MKIYLSIVGLLLLCSCTDPVVPGIQPEEEFILVEATIADRPGSSRARLSKAVLFEGEYRSLALEGHTVVSFADDGTETRWRRDSFDERLYLPPMDFAGVRGRSYGLRVISPEGDVYESEPEPVLESVPVTNVSFEFEQEGYFNSGLGRFVPVFNFFLDYDDPAGVPNYYQTSFQYWETIRVCATCTGGRYRDGECIPDDRNESFWDYICAGTCYGIEYGTESRVYSDEFTDGGTVTRLPVARLDHVRETGGLLFEAQLLSISRRAHAYYQTSRELALEGGGLNATTPAALIGNLQVVNSTPNGTNLVLGYVSTAAVSSRRVFFDRRDIDGSPLPPRIFPQEEPPVEGCPPPIGCPPLAPCTELRVRTAIQPEGWGM
ncbi:MAG: DUF4249 family protein [Bacteroidota bacterium]